MINGGSESGASLNLCTARFTAGVSGLSGRDSRALTTMGPETSLQKMSAFDRGREKRFDIRHAQSDLVIGRLKLYQL